MGVHASPSRLQRELAAVSPMPSPQKKRDLADYFKPYARERSIPAQTIPQKRPSPSTEPSPGRPFAPSNQQRQRHSTPTATRFKPELLSPTPVRTPFQSSPRSGTLPIRTPHSTASIDPPSSYKNGKLFIKSELQEEKPAQSSSFAFVDLTNLPTTTNRGEISRKKATIKDSDDDSDSLLSLDDIFGTKQEDVHTSSSSPPEDVKLDSQLKPQKNSQSVTPNLFEPSAGKAQLRALAQKKRVNKFDISSILDDHFLDEKIESNVKHARQNYEASMKEIEVAQERQRDKDLLASLLRHGGEDEDISRLMEAVDRTEALSSEKSFSFFTSPGTIKQIQLSGQRVFPDTPIRLFEADDIPSRRRLYLSGFMAELADIGELGDAALSWTFCEIASEQDVSLRRAYIDCLNKGSHIWTRTNLEAPHVRACFETLGAASHVDTGKSIVPKHHAIRKGAAQSDFSNLIDILDLFGNICQDMDFVALLQLTSTLCRLSVDTGAMTHNHLSTAVEKCFASLTSIQDNGVQEYVIQCILRDMHQHLHDPVLQAQLLSHILPMSITSAQLRIKLASIFLFPAQRLQDPDLITLHPPTLEELSEHIQTSSNFNTSRNRKTSNQMDYRALKARTYLLDTAIANGHRPSTFDTPAEEHKFNKSVDVLAEALRDRFIAIADTGATHLRRTEAKDLMSALYARLLYSVRTKPRPKKHIFDLDTGKTRDGEEVRTEEKGRDFMKQFLARREAEKEIFNVGADQAC